MVSRIVAVVKSQQLHGGITSEVWHTPNGIYDDLNNEFHFDFDPCPVDPTFNGIRIEWGRSNYVNPPYGKAIPMWLTKGLIEKLKGKTSVFLLPAYTDVRWFHDIVLPYSNEVRFIKGRLKFTSGHNKPKTFVGSQVAPFASMIVVFRP